jgi:hypothetical protein
MVTEMQMSIILKLFNIFEFLRSVFCNDDQQHESTVYFVKIGKTCGSIQNGESKSDFSR